MTMNYSKWYDIKGLPQCTFYQTKNFGMAYSSGLICDAHGLLRVLPLWLVLQFTGTADLKAIMDHASGLSEQLAKGLDALGSIKRIEQPTGQSTVVIFKYTAIVSSQNADQKQQQLLKQMKASPILCDKYNSGLATQLTTQCSKVGIEQLTIPVEGVCMKIDPMCTGRSLNSSKDDVIDFLAVLEKKVGEMNATLMNAPVFKNLLLNVADIVVIDMPDEPYLGAFQCMPNYWKTKSMTNLSDLKKEEANDLNIRLFEELSASYKSVDKHILANGQVCIIVGTIGEETDVRTLVDRISALTIELQDNNKFVDSVKDTVEEGIRGAQEKLEKEREEKMFQGGIIRSVPVVSSLYNWWSPPPASTGVTGQSFDISSGRLDKTESVYKYKIQVCDDQSETASYISSRSLRDANKSLRYEEEDSDDGTLSEGSSESSVPRIAPMI